MEVDYLTPYQITKRWHVSLRTLERWRKIGQGPEFLKIGRGIVYRIADIEAYEEARVRQTTQSKQSIEANVGGVQ